jgi:hypothetical protein
MDRVAKHKSEVETYFQAYYDCLDEMRQDLLKDEIKMNDLIENFDEKLQ